MTVPLIQTEPCCGSFVGRRGFHQRAGAATRARYHGVYCIDGETVTVEGVAARLGVSHDTATRRLRRERAKDGPVTWAGLA